MSICTNLHVIAAICGNFWQESTVNPGVWEDLDPGKPGYGLGQWTDNAETSRRTALFNYLAIHGYPQDSGDGQLEFLVYENLWIPSLISQSSYNTLSDYFASTSTNISDLVMEWMFHWEGINDGSEQTRISFANAVLIRFQNDDGIREPWHSSNSYNSLVRAEANSLRIMDFFLGNTPPSPSPTPRRRKGLKPWFIDYIT